MRDLFESSSPSEKEAVKLLNAHNIQASLNNITEIDAVDIITIDNITIDVQESFDFGRWGDIRLDLVSTGDCANIMETKKVIRDNQSKSTYESPLDFVKQYMTVSKPGKAFISGYCDYIFIFVYETSRRERPVKPDYLCLIPVESCLNWLITRWRKCPIMLNDKTLTNEKWKSVFICISKSSVQTIPGAVIALYDDTLNPDHKLWDSFCDPSKITYPANNTVISPQSKKNSICQNDEIFVF